MFVRYVFGVDEVPEKEDDEMPEDENQGGMERYTVDADLTSDDGAVTSSYSRRRKTKDKDKDRLKQRGKSKLKKRKKKKRKTKKTGEELPGALALAASAEDTNSFVENKKDT